MNNREKELLDLKIASIIYKMFDSCPDGLMFWRGGYKYKNTCKNIFELKEQYRLLSGFEFGEVIKILIRLEKAEVIKKINPAKLGFNNEKNSFTFLISDLKKFLIQQEKFFQDLELCNMDKKSTIQVIDKNTEGGLQKEKCEEKGGENQMAEENYSHEVFAQANDLFAEYIATKVESLVARCNKLFVVVKKNGLIIDDDDELAEETKEDPNPAEKLASRWINRLEAKVSALAEERKKKNEKKYKKL